MDSTTKKDLTLSIMVGIVAGLLLLPTLRNVGVEINGAVSAAAIAGLMVLTPVGYLVGLWVSRWIPVMLQFVKFGIVGGLNAMIDLGVLNILIVTSGIAVGVFYSVFKRISFLVAVTNSYFWNKYWTFHAGNGPQTIEFAKFFIVNMVGFGINVGAATFVVNVIGAPPGISQSLWANIGAVSAVFVSLFWNFIGMKFLVFKR